MTSYQPSPQDEGYSEDPLTIQLPSEGGRRSLMEVPQWLAEMPVEDRTRLAISIISGLPTTSVSRIVDAARPRLFINFLNILPAEVCLQILGHLDSISLIRMAQASQDWFYLSLDYKLWEQLYYKEGWLTLKAEVRQFEAELSSRPTVSARTRPSSGEGDDHLRKRRATPKLITARSDDDTEMMDATSGESLTVPEPNPGSLFGNSATLQVDSPAGSNQTPVSAIQMELTQDKDSYSNKSKEQLQTLQESPSLLTPIPEPDVAANISLMSSLVVRDRKERKQTLNWHYLYTQRRRLEENWEAEKYVNFQLPHPSYPEDAHLECIYTLQQSGRYLVSGSRDKSLRIWDLETRRLVRPPLYGHKGSVLCLQFDPDPEEDLIVSGSSDSTVILWRFSTGEQLQVLKKAHRESVLNVRFDHRILVTCSKDKTIKIFNRHPLHPGEEGYLNVPKGVGAVPTVLNNYGFNPSPYAGLPVKPAYSMIGSLDGHGAAVNAVQIYKNEIISASGDRNVKVWDWPLQTCTRTLVGHTKGIACVQYDGRRIVSGSSDNEVKVFDKETGLEVASLRAHTSLVRTVQAGFGDLPSSAEDDQETARHVDNEFFRAVDSGAVPRKLRKGGSRNAGSRRPEDIMAYGAKLPPGGGGGKYGRIVSGSYDETVIIWRRDKEGVWKAQHTLRQEDATLAAANEFINSPPDLSQRARHQDQIHFIDQIVHQGPVQVRQSLLSFPDLILNPYLQTAVSAEPTPATRSQMLGIMAQAHARRRNHFMELVRANGMGSINAAPMTAPPPPASNPIFAGQLMNVMGHNPQTPPPVPAVQSPGPVPPNQQQAVPNNVNHPAVIAQPAAPVTSSMARVFKLQFDARRIICCSQTNIIVGWDFANGDEKIIEASRFFAPVE